MSKKTSNLDNSYWTSASITNVIYEQEKLPTPIIFDHNGNPFVRQNPKMGFDLSGKKYE